ncbi:MAG: DEAD/DEAH box helicase, partial [Actinobacteria bacterium]|nr:DEAD/DEAH box helicase [Actinomycetota bacterium]
ELSETAVRIKDALAEKGALFFRQISEAAGIQGDQELLLSLWELVWAGLVTNDTTAPLRALVGRAGQRTRPMGRSRRGRPALPAKAGPPSGAGRWSLLPSRSDDSTRRLHALAEQLLDRHGVVTRGIVSVEPVIGGFSGIYQVLKAFEETGKCRRGYFVEGLGAAQFAMPGAVDRMRGMADEGTIEQSALVLAATDPANPFGAAVPWPVRPGEEGGRKHRPGRKVGALVVMVNGELVLYVERGGRTLLTWSENTEVLQPAVDALALAVRDGSLGKLSVEKADGEAIAETPLAGVLEQAGFRSTPRGLRLR